MSSEIEAMAARAVGREDPGSVRLHAMQLRKDLSDEVIRQVCARHGVSIAAVAGNHPANRKHHVVMARAHAAHALRQTGASYPQIAKDLGMSHHSQAMRGEEAWSEHLAGAAETVDEPTGRRALALMTKYDLTIRQAAQRLGVSHLKLKGRIGTIRAKAKNLEQDQ